MKIAFTADLHLTTRQDHPDRYLAFESILQQMQREEIDHLVIAGDLFDSHRLQYSEFDHICKDPYYRDISVVLLPGNHDPNLSPKAFTAPNVYVITEPQIRTFGQSGLPFLMIPYQDGCTMGEVIAPFTSDLNGRRWILVGHGDWIEGMRHPNPAEPGVYMPLTRPDIETFQPVCTILGHIHKPSDQSRVMYTGSPCPLDITETGRRRFLVCDSETGEIASQTIEAGPIFFDESFTILPEEDEEAFLQERITSRLSAWDLSEPEKARTTIRVKVNGVSSDKRRLAETVRQGFAGFTWYQDQGPDLSDAILGDDPERAEIVRRVARKLTTLPWPGGEDQPTSSEIFTAAIDVIYGR